MIMLDTPLPRVVFRNRQTGYSQPAFILAEQPGPALQICWLVTPCLPLGATSCTSHDTDSLFGDRFEPVAQWFWIRSVEWEPVDDVE